DGCTFEVVFENLKNTAAKANSKIEVVYKSVLNEDAVIGNKGNVNKVYGEFSNNPNKDTHGKTKEDAVIVFTYTVEVNKQDENKQPLPGAVFTLEKFVADANGGETYNNVKGDWTALSTVETNPDTTFTFEGLDDGSYRLTETKAPEHYNAIDPIYFDVTAEHEIEWTMAREDVLVSLTGDVTTGEITFTSDKEDGKLLTDVVNERGVILPETGGIGTIIFYVVGGLLVIAVLVFFIAKKRVSSK
ncbi:MAG: LPXTG cell wall anchor domain-containing protein, partial [Clostridia bacterium]|nr:LPXTG cell wall anchor domain-containing protein [Clostridia bacterium]